MSLWVWVGLIPCFWLLFGEPWYAQRQKERSEARLKEFHQECDALEYAYEEHYFWHTYGRPLPHRRHGWETIRFGQNSVRVRFEFEKMVEVDHDSFLR